MIDDHDRPLDDDESPLPPREKRHRRWGRIARIAGGTLLLGAIATAQVIAALQPAALGADPRASRMLNLLLFIANICGVALLIVSAFEALSRYPRTLARRNLAHAVEGAASFHSVASMTGRLIDRLDSIDGRLDGLEKRIDELPDYGRGVMDGATLREQVVRDTD